MNRSLLQVGLYLKKLKVKGMYKSVLVRTKQDRILDVEPKGALIIMSLARQVRRDICKHYMSDMLRTLRLRRIQRKSRLRSTPARMTFSSIRSGSRKCDTRSTRFNTNTKYEHWEKSA